MANHLLTYVIFSPLLGVLLIMLVPRRFEEGARAVALTASLVTCAFTYLLFHNYSPAAAGFSFTELSTWIPALNINYRVGIDGVSLLLIGLTSLLTVLSIAVSWNEIKDHRKEFYSLILICEVGLIGTFASLDLFLFYVFWEIMLIPMYFLIGIWGSGRRVYVALKFLLYTMTGSVIMLVGVIYLYLLCGRSFDMTMLSTSVIAPRIQLMLFLAFSLAFAIKVPIIPFHTWLPDAHTEAPTAGSVLLAGVFLKAGTYGFYRIAMPYFPSAVSELRSVIIVVAVAGIIYGAIVSIAQTDLKRLIAYSSVSHLGLVILGLISLNMEGVQGAILQMINHGFSTGALFLIFGMIYSRLHTREIGEMGGVARIMPIISSLFIFTGLASMGLPLLNNFVGEILVLIGAFKVNMAAAIVSALVIILSAVYILWAVERVFFGKGQATEGIKDINMREVALLSPLIILIIWFGVYPKTAMDISKRSAETFLQLARREIKEVEPAKLQMAVPEKKKRGVEIVIPEEVEVREQRYQDEQQAPPKDQYRSNDATAP